MTFVRELRSKVSSWFALATSNSWFTSGAALYCELPAWLALITTFPAPVIVAVLLLTVAGPLTTVKLTGRPESAVADRANGVLVVTWAGRELKVMD